MKFFETTTTVRIGKRNIHIRRAGMSFFWELYAAMRALDYQAIIKALPPFLVSRMRGNWTGKELLQIADAVIGLNSPAPKRRKKKKQSDEDGDEPKMTLEQTAEWMVLRIAAMTGRTPEEAGRQVSFYDAVKMLEHRRRYDEQENIRWMVNIGYGYTGKVQEYIDSLKYTEERLDEWAQENGYADFEAFEESEKKRWGEK